MDTKVVFLLLFIALIGYVKVANGDIERVEDNQHAIGKGTEAQNSEVTSTKDGKEVPPEKRVVDTEHAIPKSPAGTVDKSAKPNSGGSSADKSSKPSSGGFTRGIKRIVSKGAAIARLGANGYVKCPRGRRCNPTAPKCCVAEKCQGVPGPFGRIFGIFGIGYQCRTVYV